MIDIADAKHSIRISEQDFSRVRCILEERFPSQLITVTNCDYNNERERLVNVWLGNLERAEKKGVVEAVKHAGAVLDALRRVAKGRLLTCHLKEGPLVGQVSRSGWVLWIDLELQSIIAESDQYGKYVDMGI